jgi:hypothetical protein
VADSYVDASHPSSNYGTSSQIRVDGSPDVNAYLRFNVTGGSGSVVSATLRIWATSAHSTGYDAYAVADTTWDETTITSANAPPFGARLGSSGRVAAKTWTSVDVTSAVQGNGLVSIGLSTTSKTALALSSRESANPPQLVIVWSGSGGAATLVAPRGPVELPAMALLMDIALIAMAVLVLEATRRRPVLRGSYVRFLGSLSRA